MRKHKDFLKIFLKWTYITLLDITNVHDGFLKVCFKKVWNTYCSLTDFLFLEIFVLICVKVIPNYRSNRGSFYSLREIEVWIKYRRRIPVTFHHRIDLLSRPCQLWPNLWCNMRGQWLHGVEQGGNGSFSFSCLRLRLSSSWYFLALVTLQRSLFFFLFQGALSLASCSQN